MLAMIVKNVKLETNKIVAMLFYSTENKINSIERKLVKNYYEDCYLTIYCCLAEPLVLIIADNIIWEDCYLCVLDGLPHAGII